MKPLDGLRVMLTRPAQARDDIAAALRAAGAVVDAVPLIGIEPPRDEASLLSAAAVADLADWVAFTSANGVAAFARARHAPLGARTKIAAVGPSTAAAVRSQLKRRADLVPVHHDAAALADAIAATGPAHASVSIFQAEEARPTLAEHLRAAGFAVMVAAAYATVETPPANIADRVRSADAIVLTSGSGARALARGLAAGPGVEALAGKTVACIGAVTAEQAQRSGIGGVLTARDATPQGLVALLAARRRS